MAENEVLVGRLVADRYRVVRRLGSGGMGTVYVAVQEPLGREVALKVVRRDLSSDERALERFRREAISLSQAHHPHIVTLHDFGELPSGALWLAMELVRGENLRQRLVRAGPLSVKKTLTLVRDASSALAAAHVLGIIHRDLKPENILLMEAAGEPDFVKIVDFGVAKLTDHEETPDEQLTQRGSVVGTPGYIAPEISLRGVTSDPRSDLYSLGVVWFECLAGRPPFRAPTPTALLMAHALDPIPALPESVPLPVAGLVQRLLAKAPEDRPDSAEELVALIDVLPPFDTGPVQQRPVAVAIDLAEASAPTVDDLGNRPTVTPSEPRGRQTPATPRAMPAAADGPPAEAVVPDAIVPEASVAEASVTEAGARTVSPRLIAGAVLAGALAAASIVVPVVVLLDRREPSHRGDRGGVEAAAADAGPSEAGADADAGDAPAALDGGEDGVGDGVTDGGSLQGPPDAGAARTRPKRPGPTPHGHPRRPEETPEPAHEPDIYD